MFAVLVWLDHLDTSAARSAARHVARHLGGRRSIAMEYTFPVLSASLRNRHIRLTTIAHKLWIH